MSRRGYDNSLRAEQAEHTRQRILTAARELLSDPAGAVTFPAVAARAGVSEPTVYRHFPNRSALLTGAAESMSAALGQPPMPERVEELPAGVAAVALFFARHAEWFRAAIRNPQLLGLRRSGRRAREAQFRALLAPSLAHLDARDREVFMALFSLVLRAESWDHATRSLGLGDDDAARGLAWLIGAMLDSVRSLRRKGASRLIDDAILTQARERLPPAAPESAPGTRSPVHSTPRAPTEGPRPRARRKA